MNQSVSFLRYTALAEAISYLLLLFIAMPMKYILHMPMPVKVVGMIHGVLFVALCLALLLAWTQARWPLSRLAVVFLASLIPFLPFALDKKLFPQQTNE